MLSETNITAALAMAAVMTVMAFVLAVLGIIFLAKDCREESKDSYAICFNDAEEFEKCVRILQNNGFTSLR